MPALELPSTSHLSIVDADGNAVAMTTSIESGFGSGLMTEGGFLLNNEMTDFSFVASEDGMPVANRIEGRQAPALDDGADDRLRPQRPRVHDRRVAGRQARSSTTS